jgi:hypothetical protein
LLEPDPESPPELWPLDELPAPLEPCDGELELRPPPPELPETEWLFQPLCDEPLCDWPDEPLAPALPLPAPLPDDEL